MYIGLETIQTRLQAENDPRNVKLTLAAPEEHQLAKQVAVIRDGEPAMDYLYRRGEFKTRAGGNPVVENYTYKVNAEVVKRADSTEFMKAVKPLGISWAATNEPPAIAWREKNSIQRGGVISTTEKEVKN